MQSFVSLWSERSRSSMILTAGHPHKARRLDPRVALRATRLHAWYPGGLPACQGCSLLRPQAL
jgi:hypothetical protein